MNITKFDYLKKMIIEGGYIYNKNKYIISLETQNIANMPYEHRITGTEYYVIRIRYDTNISDFHLSIFKNEFNNNIFHITHDRTHSRTTYLINRDNIRIIYTNNIELFKKYFINSQQINELINIMINIIESLQHYISNTSIYGGNNNNNNLKKKYRIKIEK